MVVLGVHIGVFDGEKHVKTCFEAIWPSERPKFEPRPFLGHAPRPKILIFQVLINIVVLGMYMGVFHDEEHVKTCFKAIQSS